MSTESTFIAKMADFMEALEQSKQRERPADVQREYDFYNEQVANIKELSATQETYLNSKAVRNRILQQAKTLEEFRAALDIAVAESSPEVEKAMYDSLLQLKNGKKIAERVAWKIAFENLSPALVLAGINLISLFENNYFSVLNVLSNGSLKPDDFKYAEEIYKSLVLPAIGSNDHLNISRVELALNSIKNGLPAELIVRGIRLGFNEKFIKDKRWYMKEDDYFFDALVLVHKGRVSFEDSEFLIKHGYKTIVSGRGSHYRHNKSHQGKI